jgi:hypothetical protein
MNYDDFIDAKTKSAKACGFEPSEIVAHLFDWQKHNQNFFNMTTPDEILAKIKHLTKPADANSYDEIMTLLYKWQNEIIAHNADVFEKVLTQHWKSK